MIPHLSSSISLPPFIQAYLEDLKKGGFEGEIQTDLARRLVHGTDNSVYQILPDAILYPRHHKDIKKALSLLGSPSHQQVKLTPRGGGTGTNGQSLNQGICLDLSRHLNQILEINLEQGWARVQAGVVLDQLNHALYKHHVFFAPNLSPSSRATLGGMINTDAAGKGSRIYGKTSDHILDLTVEMVGGETLLTSDFEEDVLSSTLKTLCQDHHSLIDSTFPKLSRFMTGYNLKMAYESENQQLDLNRLIAGSEGTLGVVVEAKVKLTELPKAKVLVLFKYESFQDALGSAQLLIEQNPSAIETIDETILTLARNDVIYQRVSKALDGQQGIDKDSSHHPVVRAINLVEFEGPSIEEILNAVHQALDELQPHYGQVNCPIGHYVATESQEQSALWDLRKKGVGLLAALPGEAKPIAFVEDTVVPPHLLKEYIQDFTAILDREEVRYGLFGHVDVGCLHVRPALNLRNAEDEAKFKRISDEVSELVRSYGGLIWGEHGKGIRSAYSPDYFGELYPVLQQVKALFDPYNQLNPGKVATPLGSPEALLELTSPLRAHQDRHIEEAALQTFISTVNCNGNGQCFDYHPHHVMCPSSKITQDRLHSPKGRATVMRGWLSQLSQHGFEWTSELLSPYQLAHSHSHSHSDPHSHIHDDLHAESQPSYIRPSQKRNFPWRGIKRGLEKRKNQKTRSSDLSYEVFQAMDGCLSCKACATHCPVKVDVPQFKAHFLYVYYQRYSRPLKDYLIGFLEPLAYHMSRFPRTFNLLSLNPISRWCMDKIGLVDLPKLSSPPLSKRLKALKIDSATPQSLQTLQDHLPSQEWDKVLILVPDAFTAFYDADSFEAICRCLQKFGFIPLVAPFSPNGKGLHVKGQLRAFQKQALAQLHNLEKLSSWNRPFISLDPAVALTYRDEYKQVDPQHQIHVHLLQEWLHQNLSQIPVNLFTSLPHTLPPLFGHCTETTAISTSNTLWKEIFEHLGLSLQTPQVGCCGMCGAFGHEKHHLEESKGIFELSWKLQIEKVESIQPPPSSPQSSSILATGYSCRSQVKRYSSVKALHPLAWLAQFF